MGCEICCECNEKFEAYSAEEYAGSDEEPNYETCPDCLQKAHTAEEQSAELASLRSEVKTLRQKVADGARKRPIEVIDVEAEPSPKKHKAVALPHSVWVIAKGDLPDQHEKLSGVSVLGTYSSKEKAEAALSQFIEEGEWEEGYGYHQGGAESNIQIFQSTINADADE
jgi:hypothetical protein